MGEKNFKKPEILQIKAYKDIAYFYNHLMRSIDYKEWAEYICNIYEDYELNSSKILELSAGTCSLSKYLIKKFPDILVTDISFDMISSADFLHHQKIVCDMSSLPLKSKFDFIFSTFDSINYLTEEKLLRKMFSEIYSVLTDEGIFTFDASLEANSLRYEKSLNRKGKFNGLKYVQESIYDKELKIHTNRFVIKLTDGRFVEEIHKQKIYDLDTYLKIADETGLTVLDCYEAFTLKELNEKSDRAQFVIKRKN